MTIFGNGRAVTMACLAAVAVMIAPASAAHARILCVGHRPGCAATLAGAVATAHDGDTVRIGRGTFQGGIVVGASIHLVGAGPRATVIRGGGPVLTLGTFGAAREPTVSIDGVTITRGVTHSSAQARKLVGNARVLAFGGGIEVPPGAGFATGATVRISNSVITRNRVAPGATVHSGLPCGSACPFALAGGGGVDNWGRMTLSHVVVSDNDSGGPIASDADGAGIDSVQGSLTLDHAIVRGNRASVLPPNGRFAEGGGIVVTSTPFFLVPRRQITALLITHSTITHNAAALSERFASDVEAHANSGGVLIAGDDDCTHEKSGCVIATVRHSVFALNSASARNTVGDANAFSGGLGVDGSLALRDSVVDHNRVSATVPSGSSAAANGDSAGLGMGGYGSVSHSRLVANVVTAHSPGGTASAMFAGLSVGSDAHPTTVTDSQVTGNRLSATSQGGSLVLFGAGIGHLNGGALVLRDSTIARNRATGSGPSGMAQGGGIWNGSLDPSSLLGPLRVVGTSITHNVLGVSPAIPAHGGGLFTARKPIMRVSTVEGNAPDQCDGC